MAVDLFGTEQDQTPDQAALGPDFYRGKNFLGRDTSISLTGQEPGQSASPSAGGAPVAPSAGQAGGPLTSTTGGGMTEASSAGGIPGALRTALQAAGLGEKAIGFIEQFGVPPGAGAFETPSGQFTFSAPEALRPFQFPETTGSGELPGPSIPSGEVGAGGGLNFGDVAGPALGAATSLLGIEEAIRSGNPAGAVGPALSLGTTVASQAGLIPAELTAITGAGIPFAAATGIITGIIQDMIADPKGSKSAVQDFNQIMSQTVPGEAQNLQLAAAITPLISDNLTTEQAMSLYQIARAGLKSEELLADPLSRQGKSKAGVKYGDFPGLEESVNALTPQAWLATIRLQDILAKRGITPEQLTPPAGGVYGAPTQQQLLQMQPEQVQFEQTAFPYGREGTEQQIPGGTLWLTPGEALGKIGHYGGYEGTQPGYQFDPATTAALSGIQPGEYESGLRGFLEGTPGYAGSPLASIWGAPEPAPAAGPEPGTVQSEVAATVSPFDLPAPGSSGGERFNFEEA